MAVQNHTGLYGLPRLVRVGQGGKVNGLFSLSAHQWRMQRSSSRGGCFQGVQEGSQDYGLLGVMERSV